jgi:hypothetical protein
MTRLGSSKPSPIVTKSAHVQESIKNPIAWTAETVHSPLGPSNTQISGKAPL